MQEQERLARELVRALGEPAQFRGGGVNSSVVISHGPRECRVSCFWIRTGPQYLATFHEGQERRAGGRIEQVDPVIEAVRRWLAGATLAALEAACPFVNQRLHQLEALRAVVAASCGAISRVELEDAHGYELWAYGTGRSCRFAPTASGGVTAAFFFGPEEVASGDVGGAPGDAAARWLGGTRLAELGADGLGIEPHAEVLEGGEPARWHWLRIRDRLANPRDELARSGEMLAALAERELPTRFYSYTSHDRFCFAACSHGLDGLKLPAIDPPRSGRGYRIGSGEAWTPCTIEEGVALVERTLAACPVAPFFGTSEALDVIALDSVLAGQGSPLRATLRQRGRWFQAAIERDDRHCVVGSTWTDVTFAATGARSWRGTFSDVAAAVAAVRAWLEDRASADALRAHPAMKRWAYERPAFDPD